MPTTPAGGASAVAVNGMVMAQVGTMLVAMRVPPAAGAVHGLTEGVLTT